VSATGNDNAIGPSEGNHHSVACPKCGSCRTAVTVNVVDDSVQLTLYSCGTCEHRFSRSPRT